MDLTITVNGKCAGGDHFRLTVTKSGGGSKSFHLTAHEAFSFEPEDFEIPVIITLLRSFCKEQGFNASTPLATVKNAIEAHTFKL